MARPVTDAGRFRLVVVLAAPVAPAGQALGAGYGWGRRGQLQRIMAEIETGHRTDHHGQPEPDAAVKEQLEHWERQEAQKRARWEHARTVAAAQAQDMLRTRLFRAAFDDWLAAQAIRHFCTALEACPLTDQKRERGVALWVAWARVKADRLDPTTNPAVLDEAAFHTKPAPRDVEPFIGPWNATSPETAYRSDDTRKQHEAIRAYQASWHHGMHASPPEAPPHATAGRRPTVRQRHGGTDHRGTPQLLGR